MFSNRNVTENVRVVSDEDSVAQCGMALAFFLAGAAQRHALVERNVVADNRGLADDHAHAVVNEDAQPDPRAGMNLDSRPEPGDLR